MSDFISYLKSSYFIKHLMFSVGGLIIVLWLLFVSLSSYTHHGETAEVPDFKGKSIVELPDFIKDKDLRYVIIDSIYDPKQKPGTIFKQDPEVKSLVKHNRIVYLYVISTQAPQIAMPKLVDRSTRQALFMIESYGLKIGIVKEVAADCKGCVVKQLFNGQEIVAGHPIKKGSKIDLEIGRKEEVYEATNQDSLPENNSFE
jgi:beta-lactam-binding protein with PASTA domain